MGLNPENNCDFVSVYLDDVLVFSDSFEDHFVHLRQFLQCFTTTGLKLKSSKCHFICKSVEHLRHTITPQGISPNNSRVVAIQNFPVPSSVKEVRRFVGLAFCLSMDLLKLPNLYTNSPRKIYTFSGLLIANNHFNNSRIL